PPCGGETAPDRCHRVLREGRLQRVTDRGRPRPRFAVQHVQGGGPASHAHLECHGEVAAGGPEPRAGALPLLRAQRQERKAQVRDHPGGARQERRGGPPKGTAVNSGRAITGSTRIVGVIGDPVGHSRSPAMHNAAFDALELDWVYVAFPVPRSKGAAAVRAVAILGLAGLNVTMPHKADAAAACDDLSSEGAALGAVNTVVNAGGTLVGHSTDGDGFLRALDDEGIAVSGQRAVIVGAGSAGRAITHALGRVGAQVTVAARRTDAARSAASLAPGGAAAPPDELPIGRSAL